MEASFFLRSILIGFTLAAAVGPIWLLVMQRTLARGWRVGVVSGLGVALADAMFGLAGGLGFSALAGSMADSINSLRLLGALVLVYLGVRILIAKPIDQPLKKQPVNNVSGRGYITDFGSIVLLTLANPLTLLSFAAIYTGIGAENLGLGPGAAWYFAVSIFVGSGIWWLSLVSIVSQMKQVFSANAILLVNRISGLAITLLGLRLLFLYSGE